MATQRRKLAAGRREACSVDHALEPAGFLDASGRLDRKLLGERGHCPALPCPRCPTGTTRRPVVRTRWRRGPAGRIRAGGVVQRGRRRAPVAHACVGLHARSASAGGTLARPPWQRQPGARCGSGGFASASGARRWAFPAGATRARRPALVGRCGICAICRRRPRRRTCRQHHPRRPHAARGGRRIALTSPGRLAGTVARRALHLARPPAPERGGGCSARGRAVGAAWLAACIMGEPWPMEARLARYVDAQRLERKLPPTGNNSESAS